MSAEEFYESGQSPVLLPLQSHPDDKARIFRFAEAYAVASRTETPQWISVEDEVIERVAKLAEDPSGPDFIMGHFSKR